MPDYIVPAETVTEALEIAIRKRLKEATERGMIVFFPAGDLNIKSIGQPILMPTSIPQAAYGPMPITTTSFNVVVSARGIKVDTTIYAKSMNEAFEIVDPPGGALKFEADALEDPLVLTVQYKGTVQIPYDSLVDISFYSDADATNFLQNEVAAYAPAPLTALVPHPRKITVKEIVDPLVKLRWYMDMDKAEGSEYTLDVTYIGRRGKNIYESFKSDDGKGPAPLHVKSKKRRDKLDFTFAPVNPADPPKFVIVSLVMPNDPKFKASIFLDLT